MSESREPVEVHVPAADRQEAARLLLKAAEDTGHPVDSVATIDGGFLVPYDVAVKAGAVQGDDEPADPPADEQDGEQQGIVVTSDGAEHVGVLPMSAAADSGTEETAGTDTAPAEATDDGSEERTEDGQQEVLRGEALEAALKDRNLSTSGSADEKRARVAEYDAAQSSSSTQQ